MSNIRKEYDVVVVGGGMAGVCAAISAARHGAETALIQNRPVLGGNASSEIRMHICGADNHGSWPDARETGILEEILLENRKRNHNNSFSIFDTVLWEKTNFQPGLDLYLNTHMTDSYVENNEISHIFAKQLTTEKSFEFAGKIFIDATGDGLLAFLSGAQYMKGREGKDVFNESFAPEKTDHYTMGNTLLFKAVDSGKPVTFEKPFWAYTFTEDDLIYRGHDEITSGYWWIELGGGKEDIISDGEVIRDELLKSLYGVWDHIKNSGHHNGENLVLDWVGFLPGKRESRRITGEYILKEQDCLTGKIFHDAVAYGGWPMDMHVVEGLRTKEEPTRFIRLDGVYTIPYRCLYSKNIRNLMMAGRNISTSHMAFGSTRVMGTCAVVGQAAGTASAISINKGIKPHQIMEHIKELQQKLLKDDCYIPGLKNEDNKDMAKTAEITCSSQIPDSVCSYIINGVSRKVKNETNCWISEKLSEQGEWIQLNFQNEIIPSYINIKFDSNLSKELMISISDEALSNQIPGIPPQLVKDYHVEFYHKGELVNKIKVSDNHLRNRVHFMDSKITCDSIRIHIFSTHGDLYARVFEVRVY